MYRFVWFLASIALCNGVAALPVTPAVHTFHAPVLSTYVGHGYGHAGYGGYANGYGIGHGFVGKAFGHHIFKRSPTLVATGDVGIGGYGGAGLGGFGAGHYGGHEGAVVAGYGGPGVGGYGGGVGLDGYGGFSVEGGYGSFGHGVRHVAVAPVAYSHQARVDIHHAPTVIAAPIVKKVITPVIAVPSHYGHPGGHLGGHGGYGVH